MLQPSEFYDWAKASMLTKDLMNEMDKVAYEASVASKKKLKRAKPGLPRLLWQRPLESGYVFL